MNLIPASRFSIEELTGIYNQARVDYLVPMPMTVQRLQEYIHVYDVDLSTSVVAMEDDEALGICMTGLRGQRAWATRLGVLPGSRRRGTGRAMVEYCIEQVALCGATIMYLEVIVGNAPAHTLFVKLGFQEVGHLLILRRPPGAPAGSLKPPHSTITALNEEETIRCAAARTRRPAWTNQTESLINAGTVKGLQLYEQEHGLSGWVCYERSALQLRRVIVEPDVREPVGVTSALLYHLHSQFPTLDTVAENIPADDPGLDAFYAHGYVEAFRRVEMALTLGQQERG